MHTFSFFSIILSLLLLKEVVSSLGLGRGEMKREKSKERDEEVETGIEAKAEV